MREAAGSWYVIKLTKAHYQLALPLYPLYFRNLKYFIYLINVADIDCEAMLNDHAHKLSITLN